jgi:hypothetical protein
MIVPLTTATIQFSAGARQGAVSRSLYLQMLCSLVLPPHHPCGHAALQLLFILWITTWAPRHRIPKVAMACNRLPPTSPIMLACPTVPRLTRRPSTRAEGRDLPWQLGYIHHMYQSLLLRLLTCSTAHQQKHACASLFTPDYDLHARQHVRNCKLGLPAEYVCHMHTSASGDC